ncbi:MAG TPA: FHA domain-containing protein [Pyrinomonadaceae bacterium]|nr:FHA domain-containing protein [Pyrinomonadaceae bacterium]
MIRCQSCGTGNLDGSQYCDECGTKLPAASTAPSSKAEFRSSSTSNPSFRGANVTSVGIPPIIEAPQIDDQSEKQNNNKKKESHARLTIERGAGASTEFHLSAEESNIGRWDADNGVFPDVDLDAFDPDAKVSRRHARIMRRNGAYMIEDLGSTNGTFLNRGRRLLPGSPQTLDEGDEIIVGKTFLRFHIND